VAVMSTECQRGSGVGYVQQPIQVVVHVAQSGTDWAGVLLGAGAGILGGLLGAVATLRSTTRTLRAETSAFAEERRRADEEAKLQAAIRCAQQLKAIRDQIEILPTPRFPFVEFDHAYIDELLFRALDTHAAVAIPVERALAAVRQYNAAARYGNVKWPASGTEALVNATWTDLANAGLLAFDAVNGWATLLVQAAKQSPPGLPASQ